MSTHLPRCPAYREHPTCSCVASQSCAWCDTARVGMCTCTYLACEWCAESYPALDPERAEETKQALACDSTVWFDVKQACWMIQGHYGSNMYDTTRFKFKRNAPTKDANPVCDRCVTDRLEQGDLEAVEGHYL